MKVLIFFIAVSFTSKLVFSQGEFDKCAKYNSFSEYLVENLVKCRMSDTCFTGVYYIKIKFKSKGEFNEINVEGEMPNITRNLIIAEILKSKKFWDRKFVRSVYRKNMIVVMPLMIEVQNDCILTENKYLSNSFNYEDNRSDILYSALYEFSKRQLQIINTFKNLHSIGIDKRQCPVVILKSCFINQKRVLKSEIK